MAFGQAERMGGRMLRFISNRGTNCMKPQRWAKPTPKQRPNAPPNDHEYTSKHEISSGTADCPATKVIQVRHSWGETTRGGLNEMRAVGSAQRRNGSKLTDHHPRRIAG